MDSGEFDEGVAQYRRSIEAAREHGLVDWALAAYNNLSHSLESDTDRFDEALCVKLR